MRELVADVEAPDWADPGAATRGTVDLLRRSAPLERVKDEVACWARDGMAVRDLLCHETGTHNKWFVGSSAVEDLVIWLHEYKPAGARARTHAHTVHNHRYWFVSALLSGGYDHLRYELGEGRPVCVGRERCAAPTAYAMAPDELHSIENIADHTFTLIVQGPVVRHSSRAYRVGSSVSQEFVDFAGRVAILGRGLQRP